MFCAADVDIPLELTVVTVVLCACVQEGNADAGRYQLETAISTYRNQTGLLGSDTVLAGYHLKLGR